MVMGKRLEFIWQHRNIYLYYTLFSSLSIILHTLSIYIHIDIIQYKGLIKTTVVKHNYIIA